MSFKSLDLSLQRWGERPELLQLQQFREIVANWHDVVGNPVAKNSRPYSLNRGILFVATSSSTWAQNLTLQRARILAKLNPLLCQPLTEMRFSTAQWQSDGSTLSQATDSPVLTVVSLPAVKEVEDPVAAFAQWAEVMQQRSQHLPFCPQCQCRTPLAEMERWGICALCRVEQLK